MKRKTIQIIYIDIYIYIYVYLRIYMHTISLFYTDDVLDVS